MSHAKTSSNPNDFILPDLGEGVHEAELIKWRVSVGQTVEEHDILADMETDKAVVEVPSPRSGTIAALHGSAGEILKVGNPLVSYVPAGGAAAAAPAPAKAAPAAAAPAAKPAKAEAACDTGSQIAALVPTAANGKHAAAATPAPAAPAEREDAGTVVGAVGGALGGVSSADGKALATPAVRRLAKELGVDIDTIKGTGMAGRVLEKDVRSAQSGARSAPAPAPAARPAAPAAPASRPAPRAEVDLSAAVSSSAGSSAGSADGDRIPFRGVRRTIANRLKQSVASTVHFTVMDEADVSALDTLRRKLAGASGEKVSFLPFVAAAVCRCLAGEFKAFNSTTDDAAEEIIRHKGVHLGIATDTDNGLMVPVLRDADRLGVLQISRQIGAVADAARNRTATREQLMGSTFTISNVGSHAGRFATPIINYPEVGILAVGRARDGVVVRHGGLAVGKLLPLSLACDHRVVDGAAAALMLARLVELLQDPEQLLGPAR
jgi:pyruvate dehydrogenase E2 component (dihydrolipoamide acetyltransferase)